MATVSPISDKEAFLAALAKSTLLAAPALAQAKEAAAAADDATGLARQLVKTGVLTKWQAAQLLHGYYVLTVGKYKLLDQLAAGETGRVYLAEHAQMERRHALKILARRHASQPEVLKRFLGDAEQICQLNHRNLCHIYDVNQDGERYFLVMEYVEGEDLGRRVQQQGPLATADALNCALQAASGLAHAHERQVFHGHLKPANLLVDAAGNVKITDIGQARLIATPPAGTDDTTEATALAGAIFRSPELRAGGQVVDARCDVYSLGAVLCYLLSGTSVPDAARAEKTLQSKGSPGDLVGLVTTMMADEPDQRPASMDEVAAAIAALVPSEKPSAAAPPPKKAKKPLVARAIAEVEPAAAAPGASPPAVEAPANAFAGMAAKAGPRGKAPSIDKSGQAPAFVTTPSRSTATSRSASASKSRLPLILGAAIGGVLVLGGIVLAVVLAINWAGNAASDALADAKQAIDKSAAKGGQAPETNLTDKTESNPELNPASNPAPSATPPSPAPTVPNPVNPLTPPSATIPPPMPMPVAPMPPPMPAPMPEAPPQPEPAPQPEVKPAPPQPAPAGNPFVGFAATVNLPKLPSGTAPLPPEALAPLVLGPCVVDDKSLVIIQLKGGDGAIRGGKQKFEIAAAQGGTALRDWEISLTGGTTNVVAALLSVKDNQLTFQWTAEGAKQAAAALLCNCGLHLSAGAGQHDLALRTPVKGEPLVIDLEKPVGVKWQIDALPDLTKVFVAITRLDVPFEKHKFDKAEQFEATDDSTIVWFGAADDAMPLGIRISSSSSARGLELKTASLLKTSSMQKPKPFQKKDLKTMESGIGRQMNSLNQQIAALPKPGKDENPMLKQQRGLLNTRLEELDAAGKQLKELSDSVEALQGKGTIHFRVFYQTDDGPIDLLVTDEAAAAPQAEK
jgi:serine/threonine-protein kinase